MRPSVCAAVLLAFVQSTVMAVVAAESSSSWSDGFYDDPVGESNANRLGRSKSDADRYRVVDHEIGRPKRSSDTLYWDSPVSWQCKSWFSSTCGDYNRWAKAAAVVLALIAVAVVLWMCLLCCRRLCCTNHEHGYCDMKCHGNCAFASSEESKKLIRSA